MNEGLQERGTEEVYRDLPATVPTDERAPIEAQNIASAPQPAGPVVWLRLAYSFEFLLAILVIIALWSEVGGQGHLDMMPWYTKLASVMTAAWCTVRLTAALVEEPRVWSRRTLIWLTSLLLVAATMAGITLYYHLHEDQDQENSDATTSTAMIAPPRESLRSYAA